MHSVLETGGGFAPALSLSSEACRPIHRLRALAVREWRPPRRLNESIALCLMLWILTSRFSSGVRSTKSTREPCRAARFSPPTPISKPYLALVLALAVLFVGHLFIPGILSGSYPRRPQSLRTAIPPTFIATPSGTRCSIWMLAAGHANPKTGEIGLQHPWCSTLRSYLAHPSRANEEELWSLAMFTHESMHMRGELNEARTECEAVQRNYRAAKLLGVPDAIAKRNALDYYNNLYKERGTQGIMQAAYYWTNARPVKPWTSI